MNESRHKEKKHEDPAPIKTESSELHDTESKHRINVSNATAPIERVIRAGEAVAGRLVHESRHKDVADVSESAGLESKGSVEVNVHDNELHKQDTRTEGMGQEKPTLSNLIGKSHTTYTSVLILSAGILHVLLLKHDQETWVYADAKIPIYIVVPLVCLSFICGRYFDVLTHREVALDMKQSRDVSMNADIKQSDELTKTQVMLQHQKGAKDGTIAIHILPKKLQLSPRHFGKNVLSLHELEGKIDQLKPKIRVSNTLMKHLLTNRDFTKSTVGPQDLESHTASKSTDDEEKSNAISDNTDLGHAVLNHSRDTSFGEEGFTSIVEPLCILRGMYLFLADDPEEQIWRQPMLTECGLRKAPTLVTNLMLPFGNIAVYMKLPDWFDNWDNIPEENENDKPDVKALKRFLNGDDEYRSKRAKLVPFVVDGPMAIRLIKPKPQEVTMHGLKHPVSWHKVPNCKESSALLECDVDLVSDSAVRKVANMVRPYLSKITIDVALVISKPKDSEIPEPSACVGMWRIEKVDFESCAVIPQKSVEDVVVQINSFIESQA